jgi:hypothetical protein
MNARGLTQLYDRLTPLERASAYLAAVERGDVTEQRRLLTAARLVPRTRIDCWPYIYALSELACEYFMDVLETAARFDDGLRTNDEDFAVLFGYYLGIKVAGWRMFCDRLSVPSLAFWKSYPSFDRLMRVLPITEQLACRPQDFLDRLDRYRPDLPPTQLRCAFTPESVADALGRMFREGVERYGG